MGSLCLSCQPRRMTMTDDTNVINDYAYWQGALARGVHLKDDREFRVPMEPQAGFYRTKDNRAVAIWYDADGVNFTIDKQPIREATIEDAWHWVCQRPVSEEHYQSFFKDGRWWDIDPAIDETIGHNIEGATDPETIQSLLNQLRTAALDYTKIGSDDESKRAHGLRNRINQL